MSIITTPCDTDFYKVTMKAAVFSKFPEAEVEYHFVLRTKGVDLTPLFSKIKEQVLMCTGLRYSGYEIDYLRSNFFFKESFLQFLKNQRWGADVRVSLNPEVNGGVEIIVKGPWLQTIDWEIWILRIVSQLWTSLYFEKYGSAKALDVGQGRLLAKLNLLKENAPKLKFVDMGTRRAAATYWHSSVIQTILKEHPDCLAGTSNINLAQRFSIPCFGTVAHEWDSAHLAYCHPLDAKKMALKNWLDVFGGEAGICLTDTFTTDVFLRSFDKHLANAYEGVRHDSGDWQVWAKKMLAHYRSLKINPKAKLLTFSDSLDFPKMVGIYNELNKESKVGFGIGTNLVNDIGFEPLSIVMKMVRCNDRPVLKLSDDPSKAICADALYLQYVKHALGVS